MTNVYLVGYRCCGKSSLGRLLADRLGFAFVDTDERLIAAAGQTIATIVKNHGWDCFRKMERDCLAVIAGRQGQVVATGGGVITDPRNVKTMKASGIVVWLRASAEVIRRRMRSDTRTADQRPALKLGDARREIESVLEERTPLYRAASDIAVGTERESIPGLVENLLARLSLLGIKPDRPPQ